MQENFCAKNVRKMWRQCTQHNDTQNNDTQHNDTNIHCADCHSCQVLFALSVTNKPIMVSVSMLSVVILNVVVPKILANCTPGGYVTKLLRP